MKQQILMANIAYILSKWDDIDDHWALLVHLYTNELKSWGLV